MTMIATMTSYDRYSTALRQQHWDEARSSLLVLRAHYSRRIRKTCYVVVLWMQWDLENKCGNATAAATFYQELLAYATGENVLLKETAAVLANGDEATVRRALQRECFDLWATHAEDFHTTSV